MKNGLNSSIAVIHIPGRESKFMMHSQLKVDVADLEDGDD